MELVAEGKASMSSLSRFFSKESLTRTAIAAAASFLAGMGSAVMRASCLGSDPWSTLNYGVSEFLGVPFSTTSLAINAVLFVLALAFMRRKLGLGTIVNMIVVGLGADLGVSLITAAFGSFPSFAGFDAYGLRILIFAAGMAITLFVTSFYMGADAGLAPYDTLAYIIEDRTGGRVPFRVARIITDLTCIAIGFGFGLPRGTQWQLVGLGTIVMGFGVGPIVDCLMTHVSRPALARIVKE